MVETGGIVESVGSHVKRYFGSGKGSAETGIWQVWKGRGREGEGGRGVRTATGDGKARENWYSGTETGDARVVR